MANRLAAKQQPEPTGNGAVVIDYVDKQITRAIKSAAVAETFSGFAPAHTFGETQTLSALLEDLHTRAEYGKGKYGVYLRTQNGRSAMLDLYQECADAVMYAAQAVLEGDVEALPFLNQSIAMGARLAGILDRRASA